MNGEVVCMLTDQSTKEISTYHFCLNDMS